jgi:hypothetical protein
MAENGEEPAANSVLAQIHNKLSTNDGASIRLDNLWFEQYDMNLPVNEWVKGTPDYVVSINHNDTTKYFHTEIKIKDEEFRKTQNGGTTRAGSTIPNYGCPSFYIDIEPVYRNMQDFANNSGLPKSKFIITFYDRGNDSHHIITLEEVENILQNGWNGIQIGEFGEGYGERTYLIPRNATRNLNNLTETELLELSLDSVILP